MIKFWYIFLKLGYEKILKKFNKRNEKLNRIQNINVIQLRELFLQFGDLGFIFVLLVIQLDWDDIKVI